MSNQPKTATPSAGMAVVEACYAADHKDENAACPSCIASALQSAAEEAAKRAREETVREAAGLLCEVCADPDFRGEGWSEPQHSRWTGDEPTRGLYHVSADEVAFRECGASALFARWPDSRPSVEENPK